MNAKEIGKCIKSRRALLGVDQKSLSEICGVSVHALSDIESGKGNPTIKSLERILCALGMGIYVGVSQGVVPSDK